MNRRERLKTQARNRIAREERIRVLKGMKRLGIINKEALEELERLEKEVKDA